MTGVRPSDHVWKEGGGYYSQAPEELRRRPLLPDVGRLRDRRILELFDRHGNLSEGSKVLEVGCGRSRWLPYLARERKLVVAGVDIEPYAAELARANLAGYGAEGEILCRDAFVREQNPDLVGRFDLVYSMGVMEHFDDVSARIEVLSGYLRPGGRILTTVPNLRGMNWALQRLADLETLEMHVIYDPDRLRRVHERAGFRTIASGHAGFLDGYLSSAARARGLVRRRMHGWLCRAAGMGGEAWTRLGRGAVTPEIGWLSPHVFYVGSTPEIARTDLPRTQS